MCSEAMLLTKLMTLVDFVYVVVVGGGGAAAATASAVAIQLAEEYAHTANNKWK